MKYLLNLSTRTIHISCSADGRCKLPQIREEHKKVFNSLDEAQAYLPSGDKPTRICSFCRKYIN